MRASASDGTVLPGPEELNTFDATAITLVLTTATSFDGSGSSPTRPGRPEQSIAWAQMDMAVRKSWDTLRRTHVADHAGLFDRVSFSLGESNETRSTEELLIADDANAKNRLAELMFQYGRYLLIASSRPGDQPANLQGLWNAEMRAPWSGNYTTNIHTQMNYWPAEPANLAECHRPLLEMIDDLVSNGEGAAEVNYGCAGWCAHHNVDLWRNSTPVGDWGAPPADPVWALWPMGGVWLCQHLWEHFAFGRDEDYLRFKALPVMMDACRFVLDWLVEGPAGRLTTSPSTSPEHKFVAPDGKHRALAVGSTCDLSLIHDLFTNTIEAAGNVAVDGYATKVTAMHSAENADFVARLRQTLDRLAVPRVLPDGRVAEWSHDFTEADVHHRHISHLFAVHPGRQWANDPAMLAAARRSLEVRGNASTGWSLAWKMNLWARLGDGEQAHDCVRILLPGADAQHRAAGGRVFEPIPRPPAVPDRRQFRLHQRRLRNAPAQPRRRNRAAARIAGRLARRRRPRPAGPGRGNGRSILAGRPTAEGDADGGPVADRARADNRRRAIDRSHGRASRGNRSSCVGSALSDRI